MKIKIRHLALMQTLLMILILLLTFLLTACRTEIKADSLTVPGVGTVENPDIILHLENPESD